MIKSYAVIKLIKALPISKRITSPLHVDAAEMLEVVGREKYYAM